MGTEIPIKIAGMQKSPNGVFVIHGESCFCNSLRLHGELFEYRIRHFIIAVRKIYYFFDDDNLLKNEFTFFLLSILHEQ